MQTDLSNSETPWYAQTIEAAASSLNVDTDQGLSAKEVETRRTKYGSNELIDKGSKPLWRMVLDQFADTMVIVLIVAAIISLIIGDLKDAVVILAIVILNAIVGVAQEYRAEQAMAALKKMATPFVRVRRDGKISEIGSVELVPGDVVLLEAGSAIPADVRLVEAVNLRIEEASLTGESLPSDKNTAALPAKDVSLGDRHNMGYMGTAVTYGRGTALVVETGMKTELGRIAELIQSVGDEQTPLQKRMGELGKSLAIAAIGIVAVVFVAGILRGEDAGEMFLTAVAMAVAAVPEGLPAVVAIALAFGAQRMLKRKALIRKLPAVETLGSVTVICSDKTGTLTENKMKVIVLDVAGNTFQVDQETREGQPVMGGSAKSINEINPAGQLVLLGGLLANDAVLQPELEKPGSFVTIGDPTEGALLVAAAQYGLFKSDIDKLMPRDGEVPFSSERKRMSTAHVYGGDDAGFSVIATIQKAASGKKVMFTKGAVDGLLGVSANVWLDGKIEPMDEAWRTRIEKANNEMASNGLRVLGVAVRFLDGASGSDGIDEETESDLVFAGMVGMIDPPRPEVKTAVETCLHAGIRPIMITGDHPLTAQRIALDLGISSNGKIITGIELTKMSDSDLDKAVEEVSVFARVSPDHKLRIVQSLRNLGHIVAMTGDGVNDAPALRKSDIGVAMGINGTDVSKEAADMVLLDDNFATIVHAIEEGRTIYENVRKFIKYTMTSNAGEIYVMFFAPFLGMGLPLTAIQILWINLVTDGLPGLALSVEPSEDDTMDRPPHPPTESIFARGMGPHILWVGLLMGLVSLGIGYWGWRTNSPYWPTMVFTTLTLSQMGHAMSIRSDHLSLFKQGLLSNKPILAAVLLTFILQMMVTYVPAMQDIFGTVALPAPELLTSLGLSVVVFIVVEIEKYFRRRKRI